MPKPTIIDVKISFAFKHPDAKKRFTWKAGRGASLKAAVQDLLDNQYNYWKEGEVKELFGQFDHVKSQIAVDIVGRITKVKKGVAKPHPTEDN